METKCPHEVHGQASCGIIGVRSCALVYPQPLPVVHNQQCARVISTDNSFADSIVMATKGKKNFYMGHVTPSHQAKIGNLLQSWIMPQQGDCRLSFTLHISRRKLTLGFGAHCHHLPEFRSDSFPNSSASLLNPLKTRTAQMA